VRSVFLPGCDGREIGADSTGFRGVGTFATLPGVAGRPAGGYMRFCSCVLSSELVEVEDTDCVPDLKGVAKVERAFFDIPTLRGVEKGAGDAGPGVLLDNRGGRNLAGVETPVVKLPGNWDAEANPVGLGMFVEGVLSVRGRKGRAWDPGTRDLNPD